MQETLLRKLNRFAAQAHFYRKSVLAPSPWRNISAVALQIARLVRERLVDRICGVPHLGNDRTAYIIGLFGTGRWYINELMLQNIGERAKYFRDEIRFHPGPTSMIYSGHATMKYVSRVSGVASGNEPYIGSGQIGICRFDFCLSSSPRFVADKLGLVADIYSRQQRDLLVSRRFIRTQMIYVPIWSRIFLNSRPLPKATLIFSRPYRARDFCLSRNLLRKLSFISNPPRSRCGLRTS